MGTHILRDQKAWFGGYAVQGYMNSLALEYEAETDNDTTFGDDTRSNIGGLKVVTAGMEGVWDETPDALFFDKIGVADEPMSFGAVGGSEGDRAFAFLSGLTQYAPLPGRLGALHGFSVAAQGRGQQLVRGVLLANPSAIAATGARSAQELGAATSAQTLYAALHVTAVDDPADTLDVTIESDAADDFTGSETTRITFDQVSAIGSQWKTLAGPVTDTWWRVAYTVAGTTPSFDFTVVFGIQ